MKTKAFALLVLVLLLTIPLAGCNRAAVENVEDVNTQMEQAAAQNTGGQAAATSPVETPPVEMTTETPAETPEGTVEATAEATAAPTAEPTVEPTAEPTAEPTPMGTPEATAEPTTGGEQVHVVQAGENLFRIALRYGTTVEAIAQANGITNPALIYVGQKLVIPASTNASATQPATTGGETIYTVQPGDNLFRIALKYNMSYLYLAQYNGITNPNFLIVGQQIRIPAQP